MDMQLEVVVVPSSGQPQVHLLLPAHTFLNNGGTVAAATHADQHTDPMPVYTH
jgi:hypothetical protein